MRISDWSSDVCSSDLRAQVAAGAARVAGPAADRAVRMAGGVARHRGQAAAAGFPRRAAGYRQRRALRALPAAGGPDRAGLPVPLGPGRAFHLLRVVLDPRSEEHTSELQSLMRISYAVFCLKKKNHKHNN